MIFFFTAKSNLADAHTNSSPSYYNILYISFLETSKL